MSSRRGAVLALLGVFAGLVALYLVEAVAHHSPWIFFDELDYAMNARRVADLGSPPGGKPFSFETLYAFAIAPAWVADDVHTAYWLSKAIGVLLMTSAVFPAYALARTLAVSRPIALFAAGATVAVPAMSYSSSLMTETVAYPYAILCFLLIVRALVTRAPAWTAGAVVASLVAPLVRKELAVIPAAFAAAAILFFGVPWLGRSRRRWAAALLGAAAALVLLGWLMTYVSTTWSAAAPHPLKMVSYARDGAASVVVGVAVLPAIAGLAALVRPRGERPLPERRAFACLFVAGAAALLLYTAAKGIYFGPLSNPIEERNLIYLVPLFFAGTAVWLSRLRVEPIALVAATALGAWLVGRVPLHFSALPAADAPSLEVLNSLGWSAGAVHVLLVAAAIVAGLVVLAPRWIVVTACGLVLAWSLSSETYASRRSADYAKLLASSVPRPLEWIDHATGGASSLYAGQQILQPTDVWLLAFWNPSLVQYRSLDDTPPFTRFRGIETTGDILHTSVRPDGRLREAPELPFLVADQGITGAGPRLASGLRWRVYRGTTLHSVALGIYADGWMGRRSTYTVYTGSPTSIRVKLSLKAACVKRSATTVRISVNGRLRKEVSVAPCESVVATVPAPPTPIRVAAEADPTFVPAELDPRSPDARQLGAQIRYSAGS